MTLIQDYVKARSIGEAVSLVGQCEGPCRFLAGGTDLLLQLPRENTPPVTVIDISDIAEMAAIEFAGAERRIGAAARMEDLLRFDLEASGYRMLAQGAAEVGSPQIRNLATIGGNVCNASPSADTAAPLLALEAEVQLASVGGERTVAISQFWRGPGQTVLRDGELMVALRLPPVEVHSAGVYLKHKVRGAMDLAIVGVAALLSRANGTLRAKIALAAVSPTPIRALEAEQFLQQNPRLGSAVIAEAARLAANATSPIDDVRGSAAYRKEMVQRLTGQALTQVSAALG